MKHKILHVVTSGTGSEKFIPPFIDFIGRHFDIKEHQFLSLPREKPEKILWCLYFSKKIIIHGLWNEKLNKFLFLQPWLFKKCYWVMWGGDFYFPDRQSFFKKKIIKNVGQLITYIPGDIEYVRRNYKSGGRHVDCFMYKSNVFTATAMFLGSSSRINIQVGNSADPTNNHSAVFSLLKRFSDFDVHIYAPLSYGNMTYARQVEQEGRRLFGDKFKPFTDFMAYNEYVEFLEKIDIAIFAHNRQQAMGNIINLLGLGKKVYLRSDISSWQFFLGIGVKVFDVYEFTMDKMTPADASLNISLIKNYFSEKKYLQQLKTIFEE
ncbi:MAG: TDP-N-acetylfucosamine:lipid II N-acetylfucosaminyltransferase [Candidatus Omnitrophota bacterium]